VSTTSLAEKENKKHFVTQPNKHQNSCAVCGAQIGTTRGRRAFKGDGEPGCSPPPKIEILKKCRAFRHGGIRLLHYLSFGQK